MKNLFKLIVIFAIVPTLFLSSCKTEEAEVNEFLVLKSYMQENGMDLGSVIVNSDGEKFVIAAKEGTELNDKYIIDIRSQTDFDAGHIDGANRYDLSQVLDACDAAAAAGKSPVIICYTGQTACFATSLCRMAGYSNARALKWGMSGWSDQTDSWSPNIKNIAQGHANWTTDAAPSLKAYGNPLVVTGNEEGTAVLRARIEAVLAEGFGAAAVNGSDVLENPSDYYVNNFFSESHYEGFGHIKNAVCIQPLSLSNIQNLDPSKTIVTYCYTGQTSAVITAYLKVLGYDAKSLKFGMNGLYNANPFWDDPEVSNQWGADSNSKHFDLVSN
jgi:rhodanese-related sulfurtransferase